MLFLIGTGLSYDDISSKAVDACSGCEVYYESYTSFMSKEKLDFIRSKIKKDIKELYRSDLEEGISSIVAMAKRADIAILVGGDPLIATTHKTIMIEAKKNGVATKIIHSASIVPAAIGESGLDFYRFGQVCTIPKWSEKYKPVSFYEIIERNVSNNLHTIVLLDFDHKEGRSLDCADAINTLKIAEGKYQKKIITDDTAIIIMHNLSLSGEQKIISKVGLAGKISFNSGPTLIIIPSKMSDIEKEVVAAMYG